MSRRPTISAELRQIVAARSDYRCAYCLTDEQITGGLFTLDHIIPYSLGGQTTAENLCLACWDCNLIKGKRVVGVDPITSQTVPLFHPYRQRWVDHFTWHTDGLYIIGLTPTARATIEVIKLNRPPLLHARRWWVEAGWHPPS